MKVKSLSITWGWDDNVSTADKTVDKFLSDVPYLHTLKHPGGPRDCGRSDTREDSLSSLQENPRGVE